MMTQDERFEALHRALCRETCAYRGEPPCFELQDGKGDELPWPNENCDEPGCHALALAAHFALTDAVGRTEAG